METTLNKIWDHDPCSDGWKKLINYLGEDYPKDKEIELLTILESNDLNDAIWALRTTEGYDREIRLFECWCACQSLHIFEQEYPEDMRPRQAVETAALFAEGLASNDEIDTAARAAWDAWDAARDAAWAAWAARDAAWAARAAQRKEFICLCNAKKDYMLI